MSLYKFIYVIFLAQLIQGAAFNMHAIFGVILFVAAALAVPVVNAPAPTRVPLTSTANTTYAVPSYLGVQLFTGSGASAWTLPLSYANGGVVANGQYMIIRNIGSATITASATSPDTIRGGSFTVVANAAAEVIMNNGIWVILNVGSALP